jgi:hypothetical protein
MRPLIELDQIREVFALPPTSSAPSASDFGFAVDLGGAERATRELIRSRVGAMPLDPFLAGSGGHTSRYSKGAPCVSLSERSVATGRQPIRSAAASSKA